MIVSKQLLVIEHKYGTYIEFTSNVVKKLENIQALPFNKIIDDDIFQRVMTLDVSNSHYTLQDTQLKIKIGDVEHQVFLHSFCKTTPWGWG